jgi:hypothetical protein
MTGYLDLRSVHCHTHTSIFMYSHNTAHTPVCNVLVDVRGPAANFLRFSESEKIFNVAYENSVTLPWFTTFPI